MEVNNFVYIWLIGSLSLYSIYMALMLFYYNKAQNKWRLLTGKILEFKKYTIKNSNPLTGNRYAMNVKYEYASPLGESVAGETVSIQDLVGLYLIHYSFHQVYEVERLSRKEKIDVFYDPINRKTIILKIKGNKLAFIHLCIGLLGLGCVYFLATLINTFLLESMIAVGFTFLLLVLFGKKFLI